MITLAFIGMCLSWSFSWLFGKLQSLSLIPIELSLFYRMFGGGLLMLAICIITKTRILPKKDELKYFLIISSSNFSINFLLVYFAVGYVASGVCAVIFSLSIIVSEIISAIFEKRKISKKLIISGTIGFIGLAMFINKAVIAIFNSDSRSLIGIALSILAMTIYSCGNVFVALNRKRNQTPLYSLIVNCSLIGSAIVLIINLFNNNFNQQKYLSAIASGKIAMIANILPIDTSKTYIYATLYMMVIATVFAFICLFYLVQKIGSTKANYTALIYPVIALLTSYFYENFTFNILTICGFFLIILAVAVEFSLFRKNKALNI